MRVRHCNDISQSDIFVYIFLISKKWLSLLLIHQNREAHQQAHQQPKVNAMLKSTKTKCLKTFYS